MKYIETLHEGERLSGIYLCKYRQSAMTKNGKSYENVILQDKTGVIDAKIWDPNSQGIEDFDMQKLLCGNDKKFQLDILHCLYCLYKKNNSKEK